MKKWIALAVILLLALGGYVAAGPYLAINGIRTAYKLIYRAGLTLEESKAALFEEEAASSPEVAQHIRAMREFLGVASRGIVR